MLHWALCSFVRLGLYHLTTNQSVAHIELVISCTEKMKADVLRFAHPYLMMWLQEERDKAILLYKMMLVIIVNTPFTPLIRNICCV